MRWVSWVWAAGLACAAGACGTRPALGASDGSGSGEGESGDADTQDGTASGTASTSGTSATTGPFDIGDGGDDTGPEPECPDAPPMTVLWTTTLATGVSYADAVAVDHLRELSVVGNDGATPMLWRLDADGGLRWSTQTVSSGRGAGVSVDAAGEPFALWNQLDAIAYLHASTDGDALLVSIAIEPLRQAADIAVLPGGGVAVAGWMNGEDQTQLDVMRFAPDGNVMWELVEAPNGNQKGLGIAVDEDRIYVVGDGGGDVRAVAYDLDGDEIWSRILEGGATDYATSVALDAAGDLVIGGICEGAETPVGWLGRLGADGEDLWPNEHTCYDWDMGPVLDVAVAPSGELVLASAQGNTPALLGLDDAGELAWSHRFVAPDYPLIEVTTVDVDACGDVAFAGRWNGDAFAGRFSP